VLPPIVERELRVALLRRKARNQWLNSAWTAAGITMVFMLVLSAGSRTAGRTLFNWLFALACVGVVARSFSLTADLFSEERRSGTLGLLVLTGLTPLEIFGYKLTGAVMLASYALLGALPFFAIPFLAGGVPATQFICALVFLANALLFCVAIGLLASVLHREAGQAQATAIAIATALSLSAPLLVQSTRAGLSHPIGQHWLISSPAYTGYLVFGKFTSSSVHAFWQASGLMLCYSLLALLLAATILHRTWQDEPEVLVPKTFRTFWQAWAGRVGHVEKARVRLLATDPFCWLAAREPGPVLAAKAVLIFTFLIWCLGLFVQDAMIRASGAVLISALMHGVLNWIFAYAAAKRLGEERQSGGFEVLLTTPLRAKDIVDGQNRALVLQFRRVGMFMLTMDALLMLGSFLGKSWDGAIIVGYCFFWVMWSFFWFGFHARTTAKAMWISAWTGRPGYAALQSMRSSVWIIGGLLFPMGLFSIAVPGMCIGFLFFPALALSNFSHRRTLREKLNKELRAIAVAPIPARDDKHFKSCDPKRIFPPSIWLYFEAYEPARRPPRKGLLE
jgi:hypothetical protein